MKHFIALLLMSVAPCLVHAAPADLAGQYTHAFTKPANQPVWTVTKSGANWQVVLDSTKEKLPAKEATAAERKAFWDRMMWPVDQAAGATCLSIALADPAMLCQVRAGARTKIPDLATNKSDYFYFDSMMGVMEIRLKGK